MVDRAHGTGREPWLANLSRNHAKGLLATRMTALPHQFSAGKPLCRSARSPRTLRGRAVSCKVPRGLKPRGFPDDPSPRFRGGIQARVSSSGVLTCRLCRVSRRGCVVSILRSPRLVSWGSSPGVPDPWYWLTFYAGSLPVPATAYVRRLDRTGNGPVIKDRLFLSTFVGAASSTALERAWHPPRFIGDTRKPGRPRCGWRTTCRSVGSESLAQAGRSAARPGSPGVDLAGRGGGPTVVPRANVATRFAWVPESGWPLPLSKPMGWQNGGKMTQKGGKMATFAGTRYVTGSGATPLLSCGCVNCRRMSAERQLATIIYKSRTCVEKLVSQNLEKAGKWSIS